MSPILYAINIGTLATWLSVAGFGTFGIIVPAAREIISPVEKTDALAKLESIVITEEFIPPVQQTETGSTGDAEEIEVPLAPEETLPTPPEMPETADITPLPEIPDLPPPVTKPAETPAATPTKPLAVPRPSNKVATRSEMPTSATGGSPQGKAESKGKLGNGGRNGGSGMSDAARIAAGRMPKPSYPPYSRRNNQTGTVVVRFTVDENGRVTSASVHKSSGWPLLDNAALGAVRTWKFPPGGVMTRLQPFPFKLE